MAMLEGVFQSLAIIYAEWQEQLPEEKIDESKRPQEIYLITNPETQSWELFNEKQMREKYRNK